VTLSTNLGSRSVLVDAHVHFYPSFDEARFFDSALANVRRGAAGLGLPEDTPGWLLLTETSRDHVFKALAERANGAPSRGWTFQPTAEAGSLIACTDGRAALGLVAGRQIVTREGLEVLALGTTVMFPDGAGLGETLQRVSAADALPVLPWGFGKWLSGRGALVEEQIRSSKRNGLFLGDNGGRPRFRPPPRLLAMAEAHGLVVLPGSDPLPLPSQEERVAGFGFVLEGPIASDRPAESLKARLRALKRSPPPYGQVARLVPFVRSQIYMQLRKHGLSL
jgi:hypothetical protein